jgi:hypothetical protein
MDEERFVGRGFSHDIKRHSQIGFSR